MNRLIKIGFQCVGHWKINDGKPVCVLTGQISTKNTLYSFISNGEIKYVGKTTQALKKRMYSYENPGSTQTTNIKNNAFIKELLDIGEAVDIFVLPDNGLLNYGGFHINLAAALEDSLISDLSPPWNGHQNKSSIQLNSSDTLDEKISELSLPTSVPDNGVFDIQLRQTYFNQGFFNVSVKSADAFGSDRDIIEIYLGTEQNLIQGYINRSVNTNNTPRIMGGKQLKQWFQENFKIDNHILVEVISPTSIWLKKL